MRADRLALALWLALAVPAGAAPVGAAPAGVAPICPPDPGTPALVLPHLDAAIRARRPIRIVALGSSSTEGVMATDADDTYPAELQEMLRAALPGRPVRVVNRGIGGQDARREMARMGHDAIATRPQLVIWQVGANAALHRGDPVAFARLVAAGVRRLQRRGIDVVLMDNQRSPRLIASGDDALFDGTLAAVARRTGARLFSRDRLMRGWAREGHPELGFIATDWLHHNDLGYRCVARALGGAILRGLRPPPRTGPGQVAAPAVTALERPSRFTPPPRAPAAPGRAAARASDRGSR